MRVGFIGLGQPGGADGAPDRRRRLSTHAVGRRPAVLEPFADTAAKVAGTPAELGAASDLVCLCVVGDDDVDEVLTARHGVLAGWQPGGIIAIHSTVHPDTCREMAEKAAAQGVSVIDAPVSGGGPAADAGTLMVMVGGDADVVERCRPVFATYSDPIVHLGELGSGQVAKILNNLLFSANLGTAVTTLELGDALGIPPRPAVPRCSTAGGDQQGGQQHWRCSAALWTCSPPIAGSLLQKDVRHAAEPRR